LPRNKIVLVVVEILSKFVDHPSMYCGRRYANKTKKKSIKYILRLKLPNFTLLDSVSVMSRINYEWDEC
jgi:hypothetical protein